MVHGLPIVAARVAISAACLTALVVFSRPGTAKASQNTSAYGAPLDDVFARMYNLDFRGADKLLDEHARTDPAAPLTYSVRAAAYAFAELQRLKILETEFFVDDKKVTNDAPLQPDSDARSRIMAAIEEARRRSQARLQSSPDDRDALFAMCMSAHVMTDYTALVERRQLRGLLMAREVLTYAERLIALEPPVYDAYHAMGVLEYINSRVPFFVRWFVRFKDIEGSEQKAVEYLQIVVNRGHYYTPFSKILLVILHLRANRPAEARALLADLASRFPENPLFPKELERVARLTQTTR